ncbi:sperm equatorial segment protein 1 [Dromiciops gliroides]|uniref:sperm equatorial segment protein 1 n=1 Tax=Dromiciops gliroides TaxID=33562 RepID=UPI001CC34B9F|nr:sperm equatorial segment protein 1 [Dromiciops gliroides]
MVIGSAAMDNKAVNGQPLFLPALPRPAPPLPAGPPPFVAVPGYSGMLGLSLRQLVAGSVEWLRMLGRQRASWLGLPTAGGGTGGSLGPEHSLWVPSTAEMPCTQPRKRSAKAAVLLAVLWLWSLPTMAYPRVRTLSDDQVSSSNLSKEDSILKQYAEILQQVAMRVPTQAIPSKKQATTVSSNWENEIEQAMEGIQGESPGEIPEEIPGVLTFRSSKSNKTKPEVPEMKKQVWPKEKLKLKSPIQHPRERQEKKQERTGNTEDSKGSNWEDGLESDESDSEDAPQDSAVEKDVASTLELAAKLTMDHIQEPFKKVPKKLILTPPVKVTLKPVPKTPAKVHGKPSLDLALKVIEEAWEQVKLTTPGERVMLGHMALVAPSVLDYPGPQVHDLGTGISQPSEEAKEQPNKEQVVEDRILKKISDINTQIKHALKNTKHHMEFKDDVEAAKKYLLQSLSLVNRENTSINGHKPQKLRKEKDNDEKIRSFINFLYDFRSQITAFLNMNNIPFDLQGKATTVFSIMETMLCRNHTKKANIIKLLEDNIRMLNMLIVTVNP